MKIIFNDFEKKIVVTSAILCIACLFCFPIGCALLPFASLIKANISCDTFYITLWGFCNLGLIFSQNNFRDHIQMNILRCCLKPSLKWLHCCLHCRVPHSHLQYRMNLLHSGLPFLISRWFSLVRLDCCHHYTQHIKRVIISVQRLI